MVKQKVTVTLDGARLDELRSLVGSRSLSAAIDDALAAHLVRLRHLSAVDEWLAELDAEHGAAPPETLEWAARLIDDWQSAREAPTADPHRAA